MSNSLETTAFPEQGPRSCGRKQGITEEIVGISSLEISRFSGIPSLKRQV